MDRVEGVTMRTYRVSDVVAAAWDRLEASEPELSAEQCDRLDAYLSTLDAADDADSGMPYLSMAELGL